MGRLAASLAVRTGPAKGPKCSVTRLVESLDGEDLADLQDALASPVMSTVLADEVNRLHGTRISGVTMARHRRGDCSCGRAR